MENELKATIALILIAFVIGAYTYAMLPAQVADHWDLSGAANGYGSAAFGAFFFPALMVLLLAIFLIIPVIDPLRANIETFRGYYYGFVLVVTGFFFIVFLQAILWNLGTMVSFTLTLPILLGCLFFYAGILVGKTKRNFFIGVRTPWTLANDKVWDRTNKLGAKVFKALGIIFILSVLLPAYSIAIIAGLVVAAAVGLILYSYVEFARLTKKTWKRRRKRKTSQEEA
jgi:uncharacterized membrane protein